MNARREKQLEIVASELRLINYGIYMKSTKDGQFATSTEIDMMLRVLETRFAYDIISILNEVSEYYKEVGDGNLSSDEVIGKIRRKVTTKFGGVL